MNDLKTRVNENGGKFAEWFNRVNTFLTEGQYPEDGTIEQAVVDSMYVVMEELKSAHNDMVSAHRNATEAMARMAEQNPGIPFTSGSFTATYSWGTQMDAAAAGYGVALKLFKSVYKSGELLGLW